MEPLSSVSDLSTLTYSGCVNWQSLCSWPISLAPRNSTFFISTGHYSELVAPHASLHTQLLMFRVAPWTLWGGLPASTVTRSAAASSVSGLHGQPALSSSGCWGCSPSPSSPPTDEASPSPLGEHRHLWLSFHSPFAQGGLPFVVLCCASVVLHLTERGPRFLLQASGSHVCALPGPCQSAPMQIAGKPSQVSASSPSDLSLPCCGTPKFSPTAAWSGFCCSVRAGPAVLGHATCFFLWQAGCLPCQAVWSVILVCGLPPGGWWVHFQGVALSWWPPPC